MNFKPCRERTILLGELSDAQMNYRYFETMENAQKAQKAIKALTDHGASCPICQQNAKLQMEILGL